MISYTFKPSSTIANLFKKMPTILLKMPMILFSTDFSFDSESSIQPKWKKSTFLLGISLRR